MRNKSSSAHLACCLLISCCISFSSCSSYRVATKALGSTDVTPANTAKAYSLFWGLLNHPQVIMTPVCDSLGVNGVAEVRVKKKFGQALVTIGTLGIYSPVEVTWKCSKPCPPPVGEL